MPPRLPPRSASFAVFVLSVTFPSCSGDPPTGTDDPGAIELSTTYAAFTGLAGGPAPATGYPRIPESLTQWTGLTIAAPQSLGDQVRAGLRAIDAITEELGEAP